MTANAMRSRVTADIDFDKPGKQSGYLYVQHSSNESAYGRIPIPVICVAAGSGPTVLLIGGNHGDEYEGQIALSKLAAALETDQVSGRIIIVPAVNLPAAMSGTRTSPLDGGNLNRLFPGHPDGGPTSAIAHYLESVLLPFADIAIDLHSGGASLEYLSCALIRDVGSAEHMAKTFALARAFGAKYTQLSDGGNQGAERTFHSAADRAGALILTAELGGGARVSQEALLQAEEGIRRILALIKVVAGDPLQGAEVTGIYRGSGSGSYVLAPQGGIFEPLHPLATVVDKGELAGFLHHVDTPLLKPTPILFAASGMIISMRARGLTSRGDCVYQTVEGMDMPVQWSGDFDWLRC